MDDPETMETLRARISQLEALNQKKDEFISNVAHELRAPMTSMRLCMALIQDVGIEHPEALQCFKREIERMEHVLEELHRLARLDQEQFELKLAPVDLCLMCRLITCDRRMIALKKGIQLHSQCQEQLPPVLADQALIEQAAGVLLANAIQYTPAGGSVWVDNVLLEVDGRQWVAFSVRDSGYGVTPEEKEKIFKRFYRGEAARRSGEMGTGLGLAIVKEIVDRHQGRLEVHSTGILGQGSTFTIWLPALETRLDRAVGPENRSGALN